MSSDARHGLSWLPFLRRPDALRKRVRAVEPRTPAPQAIAVEQDGVIYPVKVKRVRQARRYTLRIHATQREAILSMPLRGSLADAKVFAQRHGAWLAERLKRLPDGTPFADGAVVPLRGEPHRIIHRPQMRGTVWVEKAADGTFLLCVAGDAAHMARRVRDYLKREARRDLAAAARLHAEALGVKILRLGVRDQSSRWGSCNSDGALSFSWRLILAPPFVLDYLAAHEVAHLVEMNHSHRFWRVVAGICPEMERAKAWLTQHGNDLHRYGASE
jgi:predicted metal-dependent hydrolase